MHDVVPSGNGLLGVADDTEEKVWFTREELATKLAVDVRTITRMVDRKEVERRINGRRMEYRYVGRVVGAPRSMNGKLDRALTPILQSRERFELVLREQTTLAVSAAVEPLTAQIEDLAESLADALARLAILERGNVAPEGTQPHPVTSEALLLDVGLDNQEPIHPDVSQGGDKIGVQMVKSAYAPPWWQTYRLPMWTWFGKHRAP